MTERIREGDLFIKYSKKAGKKPIERKLWVELIPSPALLYQSKNDSTSSSKSVY